VIQCAVLAVVAAMQWFGTWAAAPVWADPQAGFTDTTLREVVHVSLGGAVVRVRLSNTFGTQPLTIAHATIALRMDGASARSAPLVLTFAGASSIVVPPGAQVLSDSVALHVPPEADILISIYVPGPTGPATTHPLALQTNYSAPGDRTTDRDGGAFVTTFTAWYFLSGVDVEKTQAAGSVVALGDSITDGARSRVDENGRWPDVLAARLQRLAPAQRFGVLNAGINGNRILLDGGHYGIAALARLDRDVLAQSGVRAVIVLLGINDIQQRPRQSDPARIESGLLHIAAQAHERGLRVMVCTIMPVEGSYAYSPTIESTREAVNSFIRLTRVFDSTCDFDKAVRDPADPHRLLPAYDGGDHLHPSPAGLRVMGDLINLAAL
jgi:lysophospholipase L1-like esterase